MKAAPCYPPRKWLFDSIAVYARDEASSRQAYDIVLRDAGPCERLGVVMLENGERIAWVKFNGGEENPGIDGDRNSLNGEHKE
jgi:hypothetical protein